MVPGNRARLTKSTYTPETVLVSLARALQLKVVVFIRLGEGETIYPWRFLM